VVVFVFLLLFKPFGVYEPEHKIGYVLICMLHALSPSVIAYIYFTIIGYAQFRSSKTPSWTVFKECIHLAILFSIIGVASFLLRDLVYNNPDNWSWRYFVEELRNCYFAGILFYLLLLFASSHFRGIVVANTNTVPANTSMQTNNIDSQSLFIKTHVQQDDFCFDPAHLLFAEADGNYTELTVYVNGQVSTELKRISLKQFEAQLSGYRYLLRCHRGYLINLNHIKEVSGNTQGYLLSMKGTHEKVPVSRSQLEQFNARYAEYACAALA